ncbi:MAG: peptidase [Desulfuromonas sp.]|nr:MAG: peptidase [Desulfuromonas sp.]
MTRLQLSALLLCLIVLSGCAAGGGFDTGKALSIGAGALQASLLDEASVQQAATLSAQEMDSQNQVAPAANPHTRRLMQITSGLANYDGLNLNFKVYLSDTVNAFAMADGTVRVYSGLLELMPDDQVLAVIGHEIGHVKLKHSYRQMREVLITNVAFDAAGAVSETIGALTSSQLGALGKTAISAHFSQGDELEADAYAVRALKQMGKDPYAMQRSIETLQQQGGSGGGFLSSHPSNQDRIKKIKAEIEKLN